MVSGFPSPVIVGTSGTVTVTAEDQFGNIDNSGPDDFNGTVTITSSDTHATLPGPSALTNGIGSFNVTLNTAGTQSITAASGSIMGTQAKITAKPATPTITWNTPAPIAYFMPVSSTQLNATANWTVGGSQGNRAGNVYLHAGGRDDAGGRDPNPLGHVHADRQHRLYHCDGERPGHRAA